MTDSKAPTVPDLELKLRDFIDSRVIPNEDLYEQQLGALASPHGQPAIMTELRKEAREQGLWCLSLTPRPWGQGLSTRQFAPLVEIAGRSLIGLEAVNSAAPDNGNMELLAHFGTPEQQEQWLQPLADGDMRSCFAMTEPDVASSDPTQLAFRIDRDGDHYVLNGSKWYASGATDDDCALFFVLGRTGSGQDIRSQHSIVLVPRGIPGMEVVKDHGFFGYEDKFGHARLEFRDVRVPVGNLLGEEGQGFHVAQARLGPGRIHYGMRVIGMAERAMEYLCRRALTRSTFGTRLADQSIIHDWIARGRAALDQSRLLVFHAAEMIDTHGAKAARNEIAMVKYAVLGAAFDVIDHAVQVHGAAGVSDEFPLARMYALTRALRIADGPDEVHIRSVARAELAKYR